MSLDISDILADWPYRPGQVTARRLRGDDGREKIQFRLDLGLLQMEADGRPDGQRPHGHESLLDYHEHRLRCHRREHGSDEGFEIDEADCERLRTEAAMYYHRYVAEFVLEDYADVERDTARNLRVMDFCRAYAREEADRHLMEQYRPYVLMMCTRARAQLALADDRPKRALTIVRKGIAEIEAFFREYDDGALAEASAELAVLRALAKDIEAKLPVDPAQRLREQLARAVESEQYERAARLRDRLRQIGE